MGGNLSLVSALAGTPYAADFRDSILFLEEVNEEPYRIDRWMTQLDLAVGFDKAAGVMIGICEGCGPEQKATSFADAGPDLRYAPAAAVDAGGDRLFDRAYPQPVHDPGGDARHARYRAQTLTLLEPAVS
jgi:muramoyltetrapeptide carboxypeptidase